MPAARIGAEFPALAIPERCESCQKESIKKGIRKVPIRLCFI